jgi:hypothetical protein
MNIMKLPDGPGYSPDGGRYWVKGNLLFWSDGGIWDMNEGGLIRTLPELGMHAENFSLWSDEKRRPCWLNPWLYMKRINKRQLMLKISEMRYANQPALN